MQKQPEHVASAIAECERLGVKSVLEVLKNKYKLRIYENGQCRLVVLSKTPFDFRVPMKVKIDVRRAVAALREQDQKVSKTSECFA